MTAGPNVALVIVTDGRSSYLERTVRAFADHCNFEFAATIVYSDAADLRYGAWVRQLLPAAYVVGGSRRLGLAGAVNRAWSLVPAECDYLFHLEEDFLALDQVDIPGMAAVLGAWPDLSQIVLKRQAWSPEERAAGGIVELDPDAYQNWTVCLVDDDLAFQVAAHRRIFSLNPCLVPRRVFAGGWPAGNEAGMTERLNADPDNRFAFWGRSEDPPRVEHIGVHRSAGWSE